MGIIATPESFSFSLVFLEILAYNAEKATETLFRIFPPLNLSPIPFQQWCHLTS